MICEACRAAIESKGELKAELLKHEDLVRQLGADRVAELCGPAGYLGSAKTMTREVVDGLAR